MPRWNTLAPLEFLDLLPCIISHDILTALATLAHECGKHAGNEADNVVSYSLLDIAHTEMSIWLHLHLMHMINLRSLDNRRTQRLLMLTQCCESYSDGETADEWSLKLTHILLSVPMGILIIFIILFTAHGHEQSACATLDCHIASKRYKLHSH